MPTTAEVEVAGLVARESAEAMSRYGGFSSAHEALGVLAEELQGLVEAVRDHNLGDVTYEAVRVASVASRLAAQCLEAADPDGASRGGFAERSRLW